MMAPCAGAFPTYLCHSFMCMHADMRYLKQDTDDHAMVMGESLPCVQSCSDPIRKRFAVPVVVADLVPVMKETTQCAHELSSDLSQGLPRIGASMQVSPHDFDGDGNDSCGDEEQGGVEGIGISPCRFHRIAARNIFHWLGAVSCTRVVAVLFLFVLFVRLLVFSFRFPS